jgi:hypothetical protein
MDSNEGLRANLYLFSKIFGRCIRFPTSGSRTRSSVFPPRFGMTFCPEGGREHALVVYGARSRSPTATRSTLKRPTVFHDDRHW